MTLLCLSLNQPGDAGTTCTRRELCTSRRKADRISVAWIDASEWVGFSGRGFKLGYELHDTKRHLNLFSIHRLAGEPKVAPESLFRHRSGLDNASPYTRASISGVSPLIQVPAAFLAHKGRS